MYKKQYITDEEKTNCQKVADAFVELYENEDLLVLNAGKYGFVKLQYFKFPFGFDNADIFMTAGAYLTSFGKNGWIRSSLTLRAVHQWRKWIMRIY